MANSSEYSYDGAVHFRLLESFECALLYRSRNMLPGVQKAGFAVRGNLQHGESIIPWVVIESFLSVIISDGQEV